MRHSAMLAVGLTLFLFGCAIQEQKAGYTENDYPVGSPMDARLQLVSKRTCTFGSAPFLIRISEPGFCDNLVESNFYRVKGTVVGYAQDRYKVGDLSATYLSSAMKGASDILVSVPVLDAPANQTDFALSLFDSVIWTRGVENKSIRFICSRAKREVLIEITYGYGTKGYASFSLPARNDYNFFANITQLTLGSYNVTYPDGMKRTFYNLLIKADELPSSYKLSDLDNLLALNKTYYFCSAYERHGSRGYYACDVSQPFEFGEVTRLSLNLLGGNQTCNSNVQMVK